MVTENPTDQKGSPAFNRQHKWRKRQAPDLLLFLLFISTAAVILFRISIEETGYLSPDSKAYLGLAQNLKEGNGFYVQNTEDTGRHYFATWPVGYPVLIYLLSEASTLDVFWSSKVLNLLLLGFGFLMLRLLSRPYAFLLASLYGIYTFMEVYSFTWSEAPFLFGLLLLAYSTDQVLQENNFTVNTTIIFLTCLTLFLIRYMGAFSFAVPGLLTLYFGYSHRYKAALRVLFATILLALLASAYLYINYTQSGFTTGFDRLADETEGAGAFLAMLLKGLLNEFLIIRKFRAANQPDYLLYATVVVQMLVMAYSIVKVRKHYNFWQELRNNSFSVTCLCIAVLYLIALLSLRTVSYFDALDYRLLSPFSFLTLIGLLYTFASLPDTYREVVKAKYLMFAFFILSLLLNLPKIYVQNQVQQLF